MGTRVHFDEINDRIATILPDWKQGPWDREFVSTHFDRPEYRRKQKFPQTYRVQLYVRGTTADTTIEKVTVRIVIHQAYLYLSGVRDDHHSGQEKRYFRTVSLLCLIIFHREATEYMQWAQSI